MTRPNPGRLLAGIFASLFVMVSLGLAPAQAVTTDEIISRGKVIIAIDTTTAPYGMVDTNMEPLGLRHRRRPSGRRGPRRAGRIRHRHLAGPDSLAAHQSRRHGDLDLLDHAGARAAGRLQHSLCRPVVGGAGAEEPQHQGSGRPGRPQGRRHPRHRRGRPSDQAGREISRHRDPALRRLCLDLAGDAVRPDRRDGRRRLRRHVPAEERQRRGFRAEIHPQELLLRHRRPQGQPGAAAVAQHLHLRAEERRHAQRPVAEASGRNRFPNCRSSDRIDALGSGPIARTRFGRRRE